MMRDPEEDMDYLDSFLDVVEEEIDWARENVEDFDEDLMRDEAAEIYADMPLDED
ncbi:hypothetical protein IIE26_05235 [Cytobacillus oceanisediminis]|uniref:hypothetical protein n=1 Tax=Cytobacillus oceanisediminis TaxID=665099 RepID=UPI0018644A6C|nr:hypothetical protein [Cytobacillus oceanisediminis]QOK28073.1 hypothetical protein IIE26_05235 [Cytobacillus oceanisediminis]